MKEIVIQYINGDRYKWLTDIVDSESGKGLDTNLWFNKNSAFQDVFGKMDKLKEMESEKA